MSNNPNLNVLTYQSKVVYVEQEYYIPSAIIPSTDRPVSLPYAFLSKVDPWPIDPTTNLEVPTQPTQDQKFLKSVYKNIFFAKQITTSDISPVIERIDWTSGVEYSYYQDDVDMMELDENGSLINQFYVRNIYNQIFKCLWNASGAPSTVMPYFQPGNYGTNGIFVGADNYKWHYIFTIATGDQVNFMDSSWIPVRITTGASATTLLNPLASNPSTGVSAGSGDIEVINITNGGSGYNTSNVITVTITGDGTASNGTPFTTAMAVVTASQIVDGAITDITVTDAGKNYTYANVTITSASGSGATAIAPVSPVGGHGFDPISELGCHHVMMAVEFDGSEGGSLPTDITYAQVGILINPLAHSTYPNAANAVSYNASTPITVASGSGTYSNDEIVQQVDPITGKVLFSATVLNFYYSLSTLTNVVQLINITGTPTLNLGLTGTSGCSRTVIGVPNATTPDFITYSGYIAYIENRMSVQRSTDGIEQFKFVLAY